MKNRKIYNFHATIYKTGINFCVDVPREITSELKAVKGYINVKGTVNGVYFIKSLVPVKNGPHRLFINTITLKDVKTMVGETAAFIIEQDDDTLEQQYPMPAMLALRLKQNSLTAEFDALSHYRKKEVLRYLNFLKTDEVSEKHIERLVGQLMKGD